MSERKINIEEVKKVHKRLLLGETKQSLNKEYNVHASYFSRQFHKLNLEIPRGSPRTAVIANYFDNINTDSKAYLLGILFTDGYIKRPVEKYKHQQVIGLEVEQTDKLLIEFFNSKLKPNGTIMKIICNNYGLTKKGIVPIHYRTTIYNDYMANILLSKYNFCYSKSQNKNIELPFQQVKGFEYSFIRGLIDGDGSIFKIKTLSNGDNVYGISFTSCSLTACQDLANFLFRNNNYFKYRIETKLNNEVENWNPVYSLRIEARASVLWLADKIYTADLEFCLERKFRRIKELCISTINSKYKYDSFVYDTVNRVLNKRVMSFISAESSN